MTQATHPHPENPSQSLRTYFVIFAALMVLLVATVIASKVTHGHGSVGVILAMIIATLKAWLVVMYFMHVKGSSALTKLFVVTALFWLVILVVFTLNDYLSRDWLAPSTGWAAPESASAPPPATQPAGPEYKYPAH